MKACLANPKAKLARVQLHALAQIAPDHAIDAIPDVRKEASGKVGLQGAESLCGRRNVQGIGSAKFATQRAVQNDARHQASSFIAVGTNFDSAIASTPFGNDIT